MNNILNDMILPTITVKKKPKKKEEKRKKKKTLSMKRAFNKLRPSLEVNHTVGDGLLLLMMIIMLMIMKILMRRRRMMIMMLKVKQTIEDGMGRPSSPTLSYDSGHSM